MGKGGTRKGGGGGGGERERRKKSYWKSPPPLLLVQGLYWEKDPGVKEEKVSEEKSYLSLILYL